MKWCCTKLGQNAELGQIMNFHVKPPNMSDKDTVAFIHLRAHSDNIKLKDILNRMFFYGSFLQASLNEEVINNMEQWSEVDDLNVNSVSEDGSKHSTIEY